MTLKSRIGLIACGIVIFLVLAPVIILLARGFSYDFANGRIVKTGALSVKTDPRGAVVFLDNEPSKTTPMVKRFLFPKEYQVEIQKQPYLPWKKRVNIHEQQVVYLPLQGNKISLFLEHPQTSVISTSTLDIFNQGKKVFYIERTRIFQIDSSGSGKKLAATLPPLLKSPQILSTRATSNGNFEFLIKDQGKNWYLNGEASIEIPVDLKSISFGPQPSTILAINKQNQIIELTPGENELSLRENAAVFAVKNNSIYYLTRENHPRLLQITNDSDLVLAKDLPVADKNQIVAASNKQMFLLLGENLYQVNDTLEKINSQVKFAFWSEEANGLIYGNDNEIWLYRPLEREHNVLLTRSSLPLKQPWFNKESGYLFVMEGRQIKAIETDFSGQSNIYTVAETKSDDTKMMVDSTGAFVIYKDGPNLTRLKIR